MSFNKRNLILEVRDMLFGLNAYIRINNIQTGKVLKKEMDYSLVIKEQEKFFASLPSLVLLNRVKALVFHLFEFDDILPQQSFAFRKRCIEFCEGHGIFCFFTDEPLLCSLSAVSHTQTLVNEGEHILVIRPMGHGTNGFMAIKLIREKSCYRILDGHPLITVPEFRDYFMADFNPKKVFIVGKPSVQTSEDFILVQLKHLFYKYSPIFLTQTEDELYTAALVTKVLHLLGESLSPYDVAIPCEDMYDIRIGTKSLFKVEMFEVLPYEKSVVVDYVGSAKSISIFQETQELRPNLLKKVDLTSFLSKKVKVTLKIDYNSIPDFMVEEIKVGLPTEIEKARFVFGKQHFYVIVYDENGKEYMLEDSDGLEKTPIYISFAEKKPVVGKAAMEEYGSKPKFIVFDLIKLCSVENADLINPKWGFRFVKDDGNLKVKMETFDGEREAETAFLLALIFRNGLKRISTKFGKMLDEIGIKCDGFVPNEILKDNFVKAGELMKVKILFV